MKLGAELKSLMADLTDSISEVKEVIAGLKSNRAVMATSNGTGRYELRSNGRALAEKVIIVSLYGLTFVSVVVKELG